MSSVFYKKFKIFLPPAENIKVVINGKIFFTVNEMAKKLQIKPNTVKQRLFQAKIEPVSKDAIYDETAFEAIKHAPMGRPSKAKAEPAKPAKKTKKQIINTPKNISDR